MIITAKDGSTVATGRLVSDAKHAKVGEKQISKTSFAINAGIGADAPLTNVVAWRDMADQCARLKKGDRVMVCGMLSSREWNGKIYTDLTLDYFALQAEFRPEPDDATIAGMADISPDDIPF